MNMIKAKFKKHGWKFVIAAFFYYLIRDLTLYVLLPMAIAKGLF